MIAPLKEIRIDLDVTQAELAEGTKVSQSYVSKIEKGDKYPSFQLLMELKSVFGICINDLIEKYRKWEKK